MQVISGTPRSTMTPIIQRVSGASMSSSVPSQTIRDLLKPHAPFSCAEDELRLQSLSSQVEAKQPFELLVMALDIRKSTMLMKEAKRFDLYASAVGGYIEYSEKLVRANDGWFDKFTGDGFLAFWLVEENSQQRVIEQVLGLCRQLIDRFDNHVIDALRSNSRNMPSGVGVGVGMDIGSGHLELFAKDIAVLGSPVVGAVRMEHLCTKPGDVYCNVSLGQLLRHAQMTFGHNILLHPTHLETKEYPDGQEAYKLQWTGI
ncbi:MAG TPA: hypothetical protein VFV43_10705 [Limnobacter sp.]|nr:hypothetical protein [Limnobacter sp.]